MRQPKSHPLPRLEEWRRTKGMSVRQLAAIAGVSTQTVHELEQHKRKAWPRTRDRLSQALQVHPWRLSFPDEVVDRVLAPYERAAEEAEEEEAEQMLPLVS